MTHEPKTDSKSEDWRTSTKDIKKHVVAQAVSHPLVFGVLCLVVILMPLVFLPMTSQVLPIAKQLVLIGGALLGLLLWLARGIKDRELTIVRTPFDIMLLAVVGVFAVSSLFSYSPLLSAFSMNSNGLPSFLAIFSLAILYFLIVNTVRSRKQVYTLLGLLIGSTTLAVLGALLGYLGIFPWVQQGFSTVGSQLDLATVVSVLIVIGLGYIVSTKQWGWRVAGTIGVVLGLLLLNAIGFKTAWLILLVGSIVLLISVLSFQQTLPIRVKWLWTVYLVVIVAGFSLLLNAPSVLNGISSATGNQIAVPSEVRLSSSTSWGITTGALFDNAKKALIGSGPGTFGHMFSQHRPVSFNDTSYWNVRFGAANNVITESLTTTGLLGFLALVAFILSGLGLALVLVLLVAYPQLAKLILPDFLKAQKSIQEHTEKYQEEGLLFIFLLAGMATLVTAFVVIVPSVTVWFVWVLLMGLVVALFDAIREKGTLTILKIKESPQHSIITSFSFVSILIASIFLGVYLTRVTMADMEYKKFKNVLATSAATDENFATARIHIANAIALNNDYAPHFLASAQLNLLQASHEARKPEEEFDENILRLLVSGAINNSKIAVDLDSNNVTIWEERANIFENVMSLVPDAGDWALKSYEEGLVREPTNPRMQFKIGYLRALLAEVDEEGTVLDFDTYMTGITEMEQAVAIAPAFFEARIAIARAYEKVGDINKGIQILQEGTFVQGSLGLPAYHYELGRIYYNKALNENVAEESDLNIALASVEGALKLSPDYANALYTRALIYEQLGRIEEALADVNAVAVANGSNEGLQAVIDRLEGKSAPDPEPIDDETGLEGEEDEEGKVKGEKVEE
ncbi:MAG: hypothetical protein HOJ15_04245 [Candidatus Jacksonbacteria bacterium]|nr:hypothetical protein [Candidatus Jacksonbacteria bacterium]